MPTIEEKYQRYMENIKRANKKYFEAHKEIVNEKCRNYYHNHLSNNAEYKAKKKEYNKQLYLKKKQLQENAKLIS